MQDMEFTVEEGTLYMLQTRTGKRTPAAAFRIAVDMANEKLISKEDALLRIKSEDIERLFYPVIDSKVDKKSLQSRILGTGIDAVPGAAVGKVVFSAQKAEEWAEKGEKVILVRRETSAGRCRRHGGGAGNSDGDRRKDFSTLQWSRADGASAASSARKNSTSITRRRRCRRAVRQ